ncbi:glycerol kinase GlpK [Methyloprofundus sp.]|uniref:glycerol kinase GlpK n=1 Tax=Methyloprofundus sp. TaxID=2020875 RepID=UPI003D0E7D1E
MKYIIAIDQGTTSSRCIVYDQQANPIAVAQQEFQQIFPQPGWVEHDAEEIWQTQAAVFRQVLAQQHLNPQDIAGIGITNQRETTVIWERSTGKPIYNAIVWQDRRTANKCAQLKETGVEAMIKAKTGLLIDAYFSASKICWILDHVDGARDKAARGELAFGTIDSWLVWNLSNGELHITDVTNASRTLLFDIDRLQWDDELLQLFNIPASLLPEVKSSSECYGVTRHPDVGTGIPIAAIAGDQQAALFGQQCFKEGMAKCTYGTGSFLIMNTGSRKVASDNQLLTTIAWKIDDQVVYALEGSVFTSGAVIQWLRDGLHLFENAAECETLAASVADNGGVVFVPALTGLAAPHWDPHTRGSIFGITRGTTSGHITRAALEGICFQVDELLSTMNADTGVPISELRIDGGATANNLLIQFQADISAIHIIRPSNLETTALGAAYLAGIATGFWTLAEICQKGKIEREFHGTIASEEIEILKRKWLKAIDRSMHWAD